MILPNPRVDIAGPAGLLSVRTIGSPASSATPILFVHPINLQGRGWYRVALHFGAERLCVLPDLRAHGTSAATGPFGVEHWAADCLAALDHAGVERAHVVGGSAGGPIAVQLAATHPDRVASITAFGSSLGRAGQGPNHVGDRLESFDPEAMFRSLIPEISLAPDADPAVVEWTLALCNPNPAEVIEQIWTASGQTDVRPLVDRVRCSALVVTGSADRTSDVTAGRALAEALGAEFVVLDGIGHLPLVEAPDRAAELIAEHIERVDAAMGATVAGTGE